MRKFKNKSIILCFILTLVIMLYGTTGVMAYTGGNSIIIAETTDESIDTPAPVDEPDPPSIIIQNYPATMEVGETAKLSTSSSNTGTDDVSWKSSDPDILSVDADGTVTANETGTASITAKSGEATDTVKITVKEVPAESIKIVSDSFGMTDSVTGYKMDKGDTIQLQVEVKPSEATVSGIEWEVDDEEVAEVDRDGNLTALKNGKVIVSVTADDGTMTDKIEVQIGSGIPWIPIIIGAVILIIIIVLIVLLVKQKKKNKSKSKKSKYDDDDDEDDDEDEEDKPQDQNQQDDLEKEKERIRREAYLQGFTDREKEMTKVFDPKDFEDKDNKDDIE